MNNLIIDNHVIIKDIKAILYELEKYKNKDKLKNIKYHTDNIRVSCPVHKDGQETTPSCDIYIGDDENLTWGTVHCFACGFKGQLDDFISECCDKPKKWGADWLKKHFTETVIEQNNIIIDEFIPILKKQQTTVKYLDESILDTFQLWHPYMYERKLSKEVCEKFKVRYDNINKCIVFPVWDVNNNLKFLTRRRVESKKFIIDSNITKDIYLLNFMLNEKVNKLYICESQINALTLQSWGYPAVALLGTGSSYQYELLSRINIMNYILCFDGDEAGNKGILNFIKNINNKFIDIIEIPFSKDINDLDKTTFISLPCISDKEWLKKHNHNN